MHVHLQHRGVTNSSEADLLHDGELWLERGELALLVRQRGLDGRCLHRGCAQDERAVCARHQEPILQYLQAEFSFGSL